MKSQNIVVLLATSLALIGCDHPKRESTVNAETQVSSTQNVRTLASDPADSKAELQGKPLSAFNDGKLYCLGMILYATQNQNVFPKHLDQTLPYLRKANQAATGTNRFEILYRGSLDQFTNPATTGRIILIRSEAWPAREGKWTRIYGFADGHCEAHSEANGAFDAWERFHSP